MPAKSAEAKAHKAALAKERKAARRAWIASLKNVPCADCGNVFPPECMDFDHVRGEKKSGISRMISAGFGGLIDELAKCEIVCANCHRIRTKARL